MQKHQMVFLSIVGRKIWTAAEVSEEAGVTVPYASGISSDLIKLNAARVNHYLGNLRGPSTPVYELVREITEDEVRDCPTVNDERNRMKNKQATGVFASDKPTVDEDHLELFGETGEKEMKTKAAQNFDNKVWNKIRIFINQNKKWSIADLSKAVGSANKGYALSISKQLVERDKAYLMYPGKPMVFGIHKELEPDDVRLLPIVNNRKERFPADRTVGFPEKEIVSVEKYADVSVVNLKKMLRQRGVRSVATSYMTRSECINFLENEVLPKKWYTENALEKKKTRRSRTRVEKPMAHRIAASKKGSFSVTEVKDINTMLRMYDRIGKKLVKLAKKVK